MITREMTLEVFEAIERMLAMAREREAETGTRDVGMYSIPEISDFLADILNDPESLANLIADFTTVYPQKMFIDDFNERTCDLNVPYTDDGTPRFSVSDLYGENYEASKWFDTMSNEDCGYVVPQIYVTVEYIEDYEDDSEQLNFFDGSGD